eukprot:COSAG01_NODE_60792_length_292_cov_6.544041_1_plen_68_part_10
MSYDRRAMEDYYSKSPIVLYGATVCDTPMGVSQTGDYVPASCTLCLFFGGSVPATGGRSLGGAVRQCT